MMEEKLHEMLDWRLIILQKLDGCIFSFKRIICSRRYTFIPVTAGLKLSKFMKSTRKKF